MKKILFASLIGLTVLGGLASASVVNAAEAGNKDSAGKVGFNEGQLTLLNVADLDFGNHPISASDETYKTESDTKSTVQDLRGTETGWELRVAQQAQFMNGEKELTNASITIDTPVLDDNSTATANIQQKTLTPDKKDVVVMDAKKGQGNGLAIEDFNTGAASLMVPGKTVKVAGQYTTTLNWTLLDGVSNN